MNEQEPSYVFVREQQMYRTDKTTYDALAAVKRWDAHSGQDITSEVFAHGLKIGSIREGAPIHQAEEHSHANSDPVAKAARQGVHADNGYGY